MKMKMKVTDAGKTSIAGQQVDYHVPETTNTSTKTEDKLE
jgi:hypothetical protein